MGLERNEKKGLTNDKKIRQGQPKKANEIKLGYGSEKGSEEKGSTQEEDDAQERDGVHDFLRNKWMATAQD